ncbi:TonB family protein [Bdellovibrio svalbardensis]|uniref:Energy transducer TonB n=1 Tax=Bdellovibrio svalbardensis TaxID=2972972 RepID=A0ABT6DIT9_9BACT|nr:TonB family protein [Bdellovibrio svalbardensis]MDG0816773.1 energy transducer TonB [Bdellovibrio svalbardensis]
MKRQWISYLLSLALHLGAFVILVLLTGKPVVAPSGVDKRSDPMLFEVGLATPAKIIATAQTRPVNQKIETQQSQPAPTSLSKQNEVGLKEGTQSAGELGQASGSDATERDRYLYELQVLIEGRKIYPPVSKQLRETGKIIVAFTIQRDGSIVEVSLKTPSKFERLNLAAKELISGIKHYKPLPQSFKETYFEIPIEYSLN